MKATETDGWMVVHDGRILAEQYADAMEPATLHLLMSVSKSIVGILVGALVGQGQVNLAIAVEVSRRHRLGEISAGVVGHGRLVRSIPVAQQNPDSTGDAGGIEAMIGDGKVGLAVAVKVCRDDGAGTRSAGRISRRHEKNRIADGSC